MKGPLNLIAALIAHGPALHLETRVSIAPLCGGHSYLIKSEKLSLHSAFVWLVWDKAWKLVLQATRVRGGTTTMEDEGDMAELWI